MVTEVVADSPAAKAGLKQHDVLTQLDGKRLTTVEACNAQIQEIKDRKVAATIRPRGQGILRRAQPATEHNIDAPAMFLRWVM